MSSVVGMMPETDTPKQWHSNGVGGAVGHAPTIGRINVFT